MTRILDLQRMEAADADKLGLNNELISTSSAFTCSCSTCSDSGCITSVAVG